MSGDRTASPLRLSMPEIDGLDRAALVATLGAIFENAPWVAREAWKSRPFGSLDALHRAMVSVMRAAGRAAQLALIRGHPELAGAAGRRGDMTEISRAEQNAAGLDAAGAEELARLHDLNVKYRGKFGFPFVIAVRGRSRAEIIAAAEERLGHTQDAEFERALEEIARIARLRLESLVTDVAKG